MLTYRVRPRVFRLDEEATISFPCPTRATIHLLPNQPFGAEAGGGRTAVRAKAATARFNANTGHHSIESKQPLAPMEVSLVGDFDRVEVRGSAVSLEFEATSLENAHRRIEAYYFVLPMMLGLHFADPPYVERVEGTLGAVPFRWELAKWAGRFTLTTQEEQEQRVLAALDGLHVVADPGRRRLLAAAHYTHTACRLLAASFTPGEFLAEAILNFAKVLEVLFPPSKDKGTLDAARAGLAGLGYSEDAVEGAFIPALVLRNGFDSGHADLTIFTPKQLSVIHDYAEGAEESFRELLRRVIERVGGGGASIAPGDASRPDAAQLRVLERLEAATARGASQPEHET